MKYLKSYKIYESIHGDIKISVEDGKLVFISNFGKFSYEVTVVNAVGPKDIVVDIDKIAQKPNKDFEITASTVFKTQVEELSKERYDDILSQFKNYFEKTNKPPTKIVSNPIGQPLPNKNPKTLELNLVNKK
jgi:hypothetical protein